MPRPSNTELADMLERQLISVADALKAGHSDVAVQRLREAFRQYRHVRMRLCPLEEVDRMRRDGEDPRV